MFNLTTVESSIYAVVQPIVGLTTIFEEQSTPRPPTRPYVSINVGNVRQIGHGEVDAPDSITGVRSVWGHYTLTVQFSGFGAGAKTAIQNLQFALNKETVIDSFLAGGLAVVDFDNVLDIPVFRDTIWEEVSRFNAVFHIRIEGTDSVGIIETVNATGELEGNVDVLPYDSDISVTIAP